jgi:hypothetical protein
MINPDASQCDTGIRVFGDVLGSPAYGILIVNTYTETTDKPFSFYRASVVINGGYLQGNSPSAKYYAPISAGDSYVLVNNLDTAGYWTYAYDLQFSSSLQFGHKVYDTLGGTEYVDATSSVGTPSTTGSFTLTATGMTTSPTGTAYWAKYGDLVTINLPSISGTSNANTFTLTGFPVALLPNTGPSTGFIVRGIDNNVSIMVMATITAGDNTITLSNNIGSVPNTWVSSGTKGIMTTSISYSKKQ